MGFAEETRVVLYLYNEIKRFRRAGAEQAPVHTVFLLKTRWTTTRDAITPTFRPPANGVWTAARASLSAGAENKDITSYQGLSHDQRRRFLLCKTLPALLKLHMYYLPQKVPF